MAIYSWGFLYYYAISDILLTILDLIKLSLDYHYYYSY